MIDSAPTGWNISARTRRERTNRVSTDSVIGDGQKAHMSSRIAMNTELLAAASNGDTDEIERLIALGASPNFRDVLDGTTCLHRSVWKGNQAAARRILELGADPNIDAEFTMASPLGIAAFLGNIEMAKLLLAFDARLSKHELRTELLSECRKLGYSDVVHLIESS